HVLGPRAHHVAVFDVLTRTEVRTIVLDSLPTSVVVLPDNRTAYVATVAPAQILKIDFTTEFLARVAILGTPDGLAYWTSSPNQSQPHSKQRAVRH
ncbi:MAG: hypothetical protein M3Q69_13860, partial [Acidobacteriota bacterium]|nr:hypothetical protein [Acidobacteriota bacterium]